MPIYEYICPDCGNNQENLVKSRDDKPVCETCCGPSLKRKLSVFAVAATSSLQDCACAVGGRPVSERVDCCSHAGGCGCC